MMSQLQETRAREQMMLNEGERSRDFQLGNRRIDTEIGQSNQQAAWYNAQIRDKEQDNALNASQTGRETLRPQPGGGYIRVPVESSAPTQQPPSLGTVPMIPLASNASPSRSTGDPGSILLDRPEGTAQPGSLFPGQAPKPPPGVFPNTEFEAPVIAAAVPNEPPSLTEPTAAPVSGSLMDREIARRAAIPAAAEEPVEGAPSITLPNEPSGDFGASAVNAYTGKLNTALPELASELARVDANVKEFERESNKPKTDRTTQDYRDSEAQNIKDRALLNKLTRAKAEAARKINDLPRLSSLAQINELASRGFKKEVEEFKGRLRPDGTFSTADEKALTEIKNLADKSEALGITGGSGKVIDRKLRIAAIEKLQALEEKLPGLEEKLTSAQANQTSLDAIAEAKQLPADKKAVTDAQGNLNALNRQISDARSLVAKAEERDQSLGDKEEKKRREDAAKAEGVRSGASQRAIASLAALNKIRGGPSTYADQIAQPTSPSIGGAGTSDSPYTTDGAAPALLKAKQQIAAQSPGLIERLKEMKARGVTSDPLYWLSRDVPGWTTPPVKFTDLGSTVFYQDKSGANNVRRLDVLESIWKDVMTGGGTADEAAASRTSGVEFVGKRPI